MSDGTWWLRTDQDALEALDGLLEGDQLAGVAGEDLGHLEGLGQEALDLAGAGHRQLVLLRQLVHSQDGDDVLQGLVVLRKRGEGLFRVSKWVWFVSQNEGVFQVSRFIKTNLSQARLQVWQQIQYLY